jgi:hypothetical protein
MMTAVRGSAPPPSRVAWSTTQRPSTVRARVRAGPGSPADAARRARAATARTACGTGWTARGRRGTGRAGPRRSRWPPPARRGCRTAAGPDRRRPVRRRRRRPTEARRSPPAMAASTSATKGGVVLGELRAAAIPVQAEAAPAATVGHERGAQLVADPTRPQQLAVARVQNLGIEVLPSCHGPAIHGAMVDEAFELLRRIPQLPHGLLDGLEEPERHRAELDLQAERNAATDRRRVDPQADGGEERIGSVAHRLGRRP